MPSPGLAFDGVVHVVPASEASAEGADMALLANLQAEEDMLAQLLLAQQLHEEEMHLAGLLSNVHIAEQAPPKAPLIYSCHLTYIMVACVNQCGML